VTAVIPGNLLSAFPIHKAIIFYKSYILLLLVSGDLMDLICKKRVKECPKEKDNRMPASHAWRIRKGCQKRAQVLEFKSILLFSFRHLLLSYLVIQAFGTLYFHSLIGILYFYKLVLVDIQK